MSIKEQIYEIIDLAKTALLEKEVGAYCESENFELKESFTVNGNITINSRTIVGVNSRPSYKFLDDISWDDSKKRAIVIGFNPSLSVLSKLDRTNRNVVDLLSRYSYGSYYLLNIYPIVSPNPEDVEPNGTNETFAEKIVKILEANISSPNPTDQLDVILIWGPTIRPDKNDLLVTVLEKTRAKGKLFCSCIDKTFVHASARYENVSSLSIEKVLAVKNGTKFVNVTV
ncbi:DUF1643 domain-containing protein [Paracholeplasma manati]|uniref:DUF1643 domain-containing protein n=1 Tax=Paracholeplasma manati TaxID=591373 RepID=UPI0024077F75|nr:DUF1643 domain-containing protein [Paracholeplasma manati]MDG0889218.1 DUF1643 domain-containing protein [Paracholeplasma manati]